jgi:hypothetical protein
MNCVITTYEHVTGATRPLWDSLALEFVTVGMYIHTDFGVELQRLLG